MFRSTALIHTSEPAISREALYRALLSAGQRSLGLGENPSSAPRAPYGEADLLGPALRRASLPMADLSTGVAWPDAPGRPQVLPAR